MSSSHARLTHAQWHHRAQRASGSGTVTDATVLQAKAKASSHPQLGPRERRTTSTLASGSTGAKHRKDRKARPPGQKEGQAGGEVVGQRSTRTHLSHPMSMHVKS